MVKYREILKDLKPYVPTKPIETVKRELSIENVIQISANENPHGCSKKAIEAVIASLKTSSIYPDGNCTLLREALSEKYNLPANYFVFGNGTDEVISMIGQVFIDDRDECITGEITFSSYAAAVESMGGKMIYVPLKNNTFDLEGILNSVTGKTKVIFLANPNNPTGTIYSEKEQLEFIEKVPSNILVVFDQAYSEFVNDENYPDTLKLIHKYKNIIILKTFSKVYGLAALRVGYGIMNPDFVNLFERIRNPFNVSTTAQVAAVAALEDVEFLNNSIKEVNRAKQYLYNALDSLSISYIPSEANFVMIDFKKDSGLYFDELLKKGYITRSGKPFGLDTYLRISIGTYEQMEDFIEALKEILNSQGDIL